MSFDDLTPESLLRLPHKANFCSTRVRHTETFEPSYWWILERYNGGPKVVYKMTSPDYRRDVHMIEYELAVQFILINKRAVPNIPIEIGQEWVSCHPFDDTVLEVNSLAKFPEIHVERNRTGKNGWIHEQDLRLYYNLYPFKSP